MAIDTIHPVSAMKLTLRQLTNAAAKIVKYPPVQAKTTQPGVSCFPQGLAEEVYWFSNGGIGPGQLHQALQHFPFQTQYAWYTQIRCFLSDNERFTLVVI